MNIKSHRMYDHQLSSAQPINVRLVGVGLTGVVPPSAFLVLHVNTGNTV